MCSACNGAVTINKNLALWSGEWITLNVLDIYSNIGFYLTLYLSTNQKYDN